MAGAHIGTVYIKVEPDTKGFKQKLKSEVEAAAKATDAEIPVDADTSKAEAKIDKAARDRDATIEVDADVNPDRFQRRMLSRIEKALANLDPTLDLNINGEKLRKDFEAQGKQLSKDAKFEITGKPNVDARARKELERQIKAFEKAIQTSTPKGRRLGEQFGIDLPDLKQRLGDSVKKVLRDIDAQIPATVDGDKLRKSIQQKAEKIGAKVLTLDVDADVDKARDTIKGIQRDLKFLDQGARLKISPDSDVFREGVRKNIEGLRAQLKGQNIQVGVDLEIDKGVAGIKTRLLQLEATTRPKIGIELEITEAQKAKILAEVVALQASIKALTSANNVGGGGGGGIGISQLIPQFGGANLAGMVVIGGALLAVLEPLMGLIMGSMLALPGLISTVLLPVGAMVLGLDGLKKAASSIAEPFKALKEAVSAKVEEQFTPMFRHLTELFPNLQEMAPKLTAPLADIGNTLISNLRANMPQIETIVNNIAGFFTKIKPAIDNVMSGILTLVEGFTGKLEGGIGDWINQTANSFKNWADGFADSGGLATTLTNVGTALKFILDTVGSLAGQSLDFFKDPGNLKGFADQLDAVATALKNVAEASKGINEIWGFLSGVGNLGQGIVDTLTGRGADAIRNFKESWADFSGTDNTNFFSNMVNQAGQAGSESATKFNDMMTAGLAAAPPPPTEGGFLGALTSNLGAAPEAPKVEPPETGEAEAKLSEYQTFVDGVTQQVRGAMSQASTGEAVPTPNFEGFKAAWTDAAGAVTTATQTIATQVNAIGPATAGSFNNVTVSARTAFAGLAGVAAQSMGQLVSSVQTGASQATAAIAAMSANIVSALASAAATAQSQGAAIGSGMAAGIASTTGAAVAAAAAMVANINSVMAGVIKPGSPSKLTTYLGETLGDGMALGIDKSAGNAIASVKELMQAIKDVFGDASGLTINFNMGQAASSFSAIADSSKEISSNLSNVPLLGSEGPTAEGATFTAENQDMLDRLSNEKKLLDLEIKRLQIKKEEGGLSEEEKARYDALKLQRDKIGLQRDELSYQKDIAKETGNTEEQYTDLLKKMTESVFDVAQQPLNTAMEDLGIGGGAITAALDQGIGWAKSFVPTQIFQVTNDETALSLSQRKANQAKLQTVGR